MNWSTQLEAASKEGGNQLPLPDDLAVGQEVEVRTKSGQPVASGVVLGLSPQTRTIMIMDRRSGTDLQIELDPKMYKVRPIVRDVPGGAPMPGEQPSLSILPSRPGAYGGGRW
jgi:hypothetical protein